MEQQSMPGNGQPPQSSLLMDIDGPLDDTKALQILVDGASVANLRGAFGLMESGNLAAAVRHFTKKRSTPMPSVAPAPPKSMISQYEKATGESKEPTPVMQSEPEYPTL